MSAAALIPAGRYVARSKTDEDVNESTESQGEHIDAALERLGGRFPVGGLHVDNASGSKGNRGPALAAVIQEGPRRRQAARRG
jgi:hypothetical protein